MTLHEWILIGCAIILIVIAVTASPFEILEFKRRRTWWKDVPRTIFRIKPHERTVFHIPDDCHDQPKRM